MEPKKLMAFIVSALIGSLPAAVPVLAATTADISMSATVSPYISITFNYGAVSFGSLDVSAGAVTNQATTPASTVGEFNITISTNKDFELKANATDLTEGGGGTIVKGNMTVDSDTVKGSLAVGNGIAMTASPVAVDTNIAYTTTTHYHGFWLSAPQSQKAGSYTGTTTMTYANV